MCVCVCVCVCLCICLRTPPKQLSQILETLLDDEFKRKIGGEEVGGYLAGFEITFEFMVVGFWGREVKSVLDRRV